MVARTQQVPTSFGAPQAEIDDADSPGLLLVLTHGAGGGVASSDLMAARRAGLEAGAVVARVIQPYRAAGGRAPGSPQRQDAAWLEIIAALRRPYPGVPLVQGGRSNGARLACRTAQAAGAAGVVALAFPLHPPGKKAVPESSRAAELRGAGVPVLVINGDRDPFGVPDPADAERLVVLAGDTHALSRHPQAIADEVSSWLGEVLSRTAQPG
jgi:uncharacterized protein